jgi:hypothetical protein
MRLIAGVLLLVAGMALGLAYGWILDPLRLADTTPASLRADYRTDYVLMVAETYHARQDSDVARRQLALFGGQSPVAICGQALQEARRAAYSSSDLALLQELQRAMQPLAPTSGPGGSP